MDAKLRMWIEDKPMSDAKNDAHEAGGKLKRKEYERELARLHRRQAAGDVERTHSHPEQNPPEELKCAKVELPKRRCAQR
jgi:hypothetical protein